MDPVSSKMKAIVFEQKGQAPTLQEIPVPQPKKGEVLIKVESTPINPSDLLFVGGVYQSPKPYPNVPGFEGSGTIVQVGEGVDQAKVGKRVAAISSTTEFGTYAEYSIQDVQTCIEIDESLTFQQASCMFVNPLSVMAMLEVTKGEKSKTVVSTAAASALGRMMVRYFQNNGVQVINVVRRAEQVEILKQEGAQHILDSSEPEFLSKFKILCAQLEAKVFFDAIGDQNTGLLLQNMPNGTKCYVYGALAHKNVGDISVVDLIFNNKSVQGFWLSDFIARNFPTFITFYATLQQLLKTDLKTEIAKEFTLDQFEEAVQYYTQNMSKGKVLLRPSQISEIQVKQHLAM